MSVCVLGDQQHCDEAAANTIPCMDAEGLKKLNKNKKLIKKLGITCMTSSSLCIVLLLACLMGQYCLADYLSASSVVVCNAASGRAGRRAHGQSGDQHCTAGQYGSSR